MSRQQGTPDFIQDTNQDFDHDASFGGGGWVINKHPIIGVTQYSAKGRELTSSWALGWLSFLAITGVLVCTVTYPQGLVSCPVLPKYK